MTKQLAVEKYPGLPIPLAFLLADIASLLTEEEAASLPIQATRAISEGTGDLPVITWRFVDWLLTDPAYGLTTLAKRSDTQTCIQHVLATFVWPQARGAKHDEVRAGNARRAVAELQRTTWWAYSTEETRPNRARIEWMISQALGSAIDRTLTQAVHSAMTAWGTAVDGSVGHGAMDFYRAVRNQILALLAMDTTRQKRASA